MSRKSGPSGRRARLILWSVALALAIPWAVQAAPGRQIAVLLDGEAEYNKAYQTLFTSELKTLTEGQFDLSFTVFKGDWTRAGIEKAVEDALASKPDVVLSLGILTSDVVGRRAELPTPVVAALMLDRGLQNLGAEQGSGKANLTYLVSPSAAANDLALFSRITPMKHLAILISKATLDAVPELKTRAMALIKSRGGEATIVPVSREDIPGTLAAIPAEADAVYVGPLGDVPRAAQDALIEGINTRKLPSMAFLGRLMVDRGILVGLATSDDWTRRSRQIAIHVQSVLEGQRPETLPVLFPRQERLVLNVATSRRIGYSPTFEILTEAELIKDERAVPDRQLTLASAIEEAFSRNLDLQVADRQLAADTEDVEIAEANFMPSVSVSAQGSIIDEDRAETSFGNAPQRAGNAIISGSQLLYDPGAHGNVKVRRALLRGSRQERATVTLDVVSQVAGAYIIVLRAGTVERIQKENLKATRRNLELARVRQALGAARTTEVLRWQAELANGRQSVISASAQRNQAEIALNRLLNQPAEKPFAAAEPAPEDLGIEAEIDRRIQDVRGFKTFRAFMTEEGLSNSPELKQLDASIEAQQAAVQLARRVFWIPQLAIQGELNHRFTKGGAGTEFNPAIGNPPDETTWQVGLAATLPLYEGGSRFAELRQADQNLARLTSQRAAVALQIEQRVRSSLHAVGASRAAVDLAAESARVSEENLTAVQEAYRLGAANITQLIDAQTAAFSNKQLAADARYQFYLDLIEAFRSVGQYPFLLDANGRTAFSTRLSQFMKAKEAPAGGDAR